MKKSASKSKSSIEYPVGDRIAHLRERLKMTQVDLSKKAGVSQSTIAQIESGKKDPSVQTLKKLAGALDVHLAILFAGDDVHVFDMKRLRAKYKSADKLHPTLYHALGMVVQYARDIGF
jgi:transcriptional regulator with XRE-family HTH domain